MRDVVRRPCILDGELVALDEDGHPRFEWMMSSRAHTFVAFDLLRDGRKWLTERPWIDRSEKRMKLVIAETPEILVPGSVDDGIGLYAECERRLIEGIVAKRIDSPYVSGRSDAWVKCKTAYGRRVTRARMIHSA